MNDIELAQKLAALGVTYNKPPSVLVRDWRIAGGLMERCANVAFWNVRPHQPSFDVSAFAEERSGGSKRAENDSLPRAIIEACVKALS